MKVLVGYVSKTGNTKKVAEAIFGEITEEKEIKTLGEIANLEGYDLSFLGFPIHGYGPDKKAKRFLKEHSKGKKVALFITHASPEDFELVPEWLGKFKEAVDEANLVGMFHCQGQLATSVRRMMSIHFNPQVRSWAREDSSQGQPDASRLEKARAFARLTMEKVAQ